MSAPSGRYEVLGQTLARAQDALRDTSAAAERAAVRARLLAAASPTPRRRGWMIATATLAVVAAVLAVLWLPRAGALTFELEPDGEPGVVGAWLAASAADARTLRFSDGSSIELQPRAQARVALLRPTAARVVLEAGGALVHVEPSEERSWQIDAGPYRIRVTGTRFFVGWDPASESLELELHEGAVIVEGPHLDGTRSVGVGQRLLVAGSDANLADVKSGAHGRTPAAPLPIGPSASDSASAVDPAEAIALDPTRAPDRGAPAHPEDAELSSRRRTAASPPATPLVDWRELARTGDYRDALAAAEAQGYGGLCETLPAGDLLRLADVARFARRPGRAITALAAVRERFPDTDEAATASFERGRIALAGDDDTEAASWFETYLRERPKGALAGEAMGRLMETLSDGARRSAARATARRYLERYPTGPHADLAEQLVDDTD